MEKRKVVSVGIIILMVAGILTASAFNYTGNAINSEETIRIGSILILSGEGASWGISSRNGIDMAIEEINSEGGINGKLMSVNHQDDQSSPKNAISAFHYLTDFEGINIIIGTTWSHTGLAVMNDAHKKRVLTVSPSLGVREFNEHSEFLFNTWPHDELLSRELADYVYESGHRRVAMIGAQMVWVKDQTEAFTERFEELGGTIEVLVEPDITAKVVNVEALKIKENSKIDAIVSTTDGVLVGVLIAKRARELGVGLPIYSITIDKDVIEAAEGAYEGMEFLTSLTPDPDFQRRYEEKFRIPIDIGADSAYDAVMLIAEAMRETGSEDPTVLQEYLNKVKSYEGVSGSLVSDGKGGFTKDFAIKKVVDGEAVDI